MKKNHYEKKSIDQQIKEQKLLIEVKRNKLIDTVLSMLETLKPILEEKIQEFKNERKYSN